ncbi:hypothetical protein DPSP01_014236 [Paraphaeosphaeria sporulosa]
MLADGAGGDHLHKFIHIELGSGPFLADFCDAFSFADLSLASERLDSDDKLYKDEVRTVAADMEKACLLLCISFLNHTLQGIHFESVILSLLSVLGIDEKPGGVFRSTLNYSSDATEPGNNEECNC